MENKCYIASAGSGKTTLLVNQALQTAERTRKRVAIVTYTSRNQEEPIIPTAVEYMGGMLQAERAL